MVTWNISGAKMEHPALNTKPISYRPPNMMPIMLVVIMWVLITIISAHAADVTVTFTQEEAQTLINDLDLATKAGGLQVAVTALPIVQKLQQAASAPPVTPTPVPEKKP